MKRLQDEETQHRLWFLSFHAHIAQGKSRQRAGELVRNEARFLITREPQRKVDLTLAWNSFLKKLVASFK